MLIQTKTPLTTALNRDEVLHDYRVAYQSRQASLIGRREVLSGKAKFGIFGDGKELPLIALAKVFRKGDWRSGYYRDQTFMFATESGSIQEFFAQLYATPSIEDDPFSGGRCMNGHYATRSLNPDGSWRDLTQIYNSAPDISPTGSQMPRLVGLGQASKVFRHVAELRHFAHLSRNGDEVVFGTIGNAATAEGMFWESVNAIGVMQTPVIISIWDDHYGISVSNEYQLTSDLSTMLKGFQREGDKRGFNIYTVPAWDYPALLETYGVAAATARRDHTPAIVHVVEVTQPQGHSTSGSHERYKSKERLAWETEYDCVRKFREWLIAQQVATPDELDSLEQEDKQYVESIRKQAWDALITPIQAEMLEVSDMLDEIAPTSAYAAEFAQIKNRMLNVPLPQRRDISHAIHHALRLMRTENNPHKQLLTDWRARLETAQQERYGSHLYSQSKESALKVAEVKPIYSENSPLVYGFELMNACFDAMLARDPRVIAFGEDVGKLGDVNQGFAGMQAKYGEWRVSDTGIRECTIIGQAIGLALRGLRPIAEIQYLDYLLYALQLMSDDLATMHWRTRGGQKAPAIIRTRGHRLEGVWHSGSPMASIIHLVRGMHVLVPRNMTQAAGFYNTLLQSDEPGLIVEVLNGYRIKEKLPDNMSEFTVPLGVPEVLREGDDITLVTYGACCRLVLEAAESLSQAGIECEVIDVQTLLPFDINGRIVESLKKTNRILFIDEDMPGGATAYMMQEVIEKQGGYYHLDSEARTLSATAHRPAYGSDGDHWSKPNTESIFDLAYEIMHESDLQTYPIFNHS